MPTKQAIEDFLAQKHIAVVGVSRNPKQFANLVLEELRHRGYRAYPVNRWAESILGERSYPSVREVPDPLDCVLVLVNAEAAKEVVRDCISRGVPRVWLHRGVGRGAVSEEAVALCRENGIEVIDGACPFMFVEHTRGIHRVHGWLAAKRIAA